jgi:hypothetical protein
MEWGRYIQCLATKLINVCFLIIFPYCCSTWFQYQMTNALTKSRRVSPVKQELITLLEHVFNPPHVFIRVCVFYPVFYESFFVCWSFFLWTLNCLFFHDLRMLITPLICPDFLNTTFWIMFIIKIKFSIDIVIQLIIHANV